MNITVAMRSGLRLLTGGYDGVMRFDIFVDPAKLQLFATWFFCNEAWRM